MPKYSIIIVSYKSGGDLPRLFDCLEKQSNQDFETILIDNASPENPPQLGEINRATQYIANIENSGFARANNQGSKIAQGEWLILLNPDAFPEKDWLNEIDVAIKKYPDCDNFGCLQMLDGHEGLMDGAGDCFSISGIAWRGGHRKPLIKDLVDGEAFASCGAASVWKREKYLFLGGFEEGFGSYYEDVDLGFRHRLIGGKTIQLAKAIVSHKGSASSSRYSEYAVFHGIRNRELAYIRLMPSIIMWLILPIHILAILALWLHAIIRGAGKPYAKGIFAAVKLIPNAFAQRKIIQNARTANLTKILRLMSFSPFALLKRDVVLRKIK